MDTDPDGDGFTNELTRADVTAVSIWQATLQVPGRVIPRDPDVERAVLDGERAFERIGCATCHVPRLPLDKQGWIFSEPNPFNPAGNLRIGETRDLKVDLSSALLPAPRLQPDAIRHRVGRRVHRLQAPRHLRAGRAGAAEPLDQNTSQWSPKIMDGNCRFLTKRLWGAANEPPFFHHGLFTTLRRSVLAHSGEAKESRRAFESLPAPRARRRDRVPQDAAGAAAGHEGSHRRRDIPREDVAAARAGPNVPDLAGARA